MLLLLDVSGSMEKYVGQVADVAQQSLKHLRPRDRVGVMIFARTDKVTQPFTYDFAAVESAIRDSVKDQSVGSATEMNARSRRCRQISRSKRRDRSPGDPHPHR